MYAWWIVHTLRGEEAGGFEHGSGHQIEGVVGVPGASGQVDHLAACQEVERAALQLAALYVGTGRGYDVLPQPGHRKLPAGVAKVGEEGAALAVGEGFEWDGAVAACRGQDEVGVGEGPFGVRGRREAGVGGGGPGRGVYVADLDNGAEAAGGVCGAAADRTVAHDEDRLAVEREAGHVQEGVRGHK